MMKILICVYQLRQLEYLRRQHYPVINQEKYEKFVNIVDAARMDQDSVGGKVECAIIGLNLVLVNRF